MSALPSSTLPASPLAARCCKVCGRPLPVRTTGRPGDFCPANGKERSDCARLDERIREVSRLVENIAASCGDDNEELRRSLQKIKGFLWSEANAATNFGKLVGTTDRKRYGKKRSGWWRLAPA